MYFYAYYCSFHIRKNPATEGFSACGGSLQRHHSPPTQCDPARRAFYFAGKFNEVSCKAKNSPVSGLMLFTGESCFTYCFISVLFLITSALLFLPALSVPPQYL